MNSFLATIVAEKRALVERLKREQPLDLAMESDSHPERSFRDVLSSRSGVNIIAELKKASPSKGVLDPDFDVSARATAYANGGAVALSVLTEEKYFLGSPAYLRTAHEASGLPVLCKDFLVDPYQIDQARVSDAHAVLLICRLLDASLLTSLIRRARILGMDSLVEAHTSDEILMAIDAGATIIGVNCRDLDTFSLDLSLHARLRSAIPNTVVAVAESGINGPEDIRRLRDCGYNHFLVGELLMRSQSPAQTLRELQST